MGLGSPRASVVERSGAKADSLSIFLLATASLAAQQEPTVEWKTSLASLDQRLSSLRGVGSEADAWSADAEALRSSIALYLASHPAVQIVAPEPLGPSPERAALAQQLDRLKAAVDAVVKQDPDSPFNLGRVMVTVSGNHAGYLACYG